MTATALLLYTCVLFQKRKPALGRDETPIM